MALQMDEEFAGSGPGSGSGSGSGTGSGSGGGPGGGSGAGSGGGSGTGSGGGSGTGGAPAGETGSGSGGGAGSGAGSGSGGDSGSGSSSSPSPTPAQADPEQAARDKAIADQEDEDFDADYHQGIGGVATHAINAISELSLGHVSSAAHNLASAAEAGLDVMTGGATGTLEKAHDLSLNGDMPSGEGNETSNDELVRALGVDPAAPHEGVGSTYGRN